MVMMDPQNEDTVMGEAATESGHDTNGFIDPRALHQDITADINFAEDMTNMTEVTEITEVSAEPSITPPRRKYLPTGCCYDDRMKLHANADFSISPAHPEDPRRIASIMKILKDNGLIYTGPEEKLAQILRDSPTKFMYRIIARAATPAEICTVHTAAHYEWVANTAKMPSEELRELSQSLDSGRRSLYLGNLSFEAALISTGGAIETCKNVVAGTVKNALAVIRPPGHHAESDEAMGFCLFNNVPIAARVCQADFPDLCRKILILDWDVHHGNGVQNIFYQDPNVLYVSLHVYDNGQFYPGQPEDPSVPDAGHKNVGAGPGSGKNVNIPWKSQGMGDGEYLGAFQRIVMPIAQEFNPDLVIVSAGFDAAAGDELGGCFVTPACYAHMTHMLMSLAGGKIAVCLEGGYNLKAISRSALAVAQTLMGEPPPRIEMPPINKDALNVLNKVREAQAPFWECMRPGKIDVGLEQDLGGVRLNVPIRTYQYNVLREKYKMVDLFILRDKPANALKHQVLATRGLSSAKKILLIVHDPPKILAMPDPVDFSLEGHNAWVNDGVMPYIDWAIANGFAIIDVNMPMHIDDPEESEEEGYIDRPPEAVHRERMKEIMCFLWDNYLEMHDSDNIVLMGVGASYGAVRELLINRESRHKIPLVLNFVAASSLLPVRSETDPSLAHWYKEHSRVYVAADHLCWEDELMQKKVRKSRFGTVVKSQERGLNRMMHAHFGDATEWVREGLEEGEGEEE